MWNSDHFTYSAAPAEGGVPVRDMLRYSVEVRGLDEQGRMGDPVTFLVLIEDQGNPSWNEAHAIAKARELAAAIGNDGALRVQGSTAAAV